jgi:hypothetical protein
LARRGGTSFSRRFLVDAQISPEVETQILIPFGSVSFVCLDYGITCTKFDPEKVAAILRREAGSS